MKTKDWLEESRQKMKKRENKKDGEEKKEAKMYFADELLLCFKLCKKRVRLKF